MDKEKLIQQLMATFVVELEEYVNVLNRDLLALEKAKLKAEEEELLQNLFRTTHSLKGASRSANILLVETACHKLEEILADVGKGMPLEAKGYELLFKTVDGLQEIGSRLKEKQDLTGSSLSRLLEQLVTEADRRRAAKAMRSSPAPGTMSKQLLRVNTASKEDGLSSAPSMALSSSIASSASPSRLRISLEKVDALLAETGELLISSGGTETRFDILEEVRQFVKRCSGCNKNLTTLLPKAMKAVSAEVALGVETLPQKPAVLQQLESLIGQQREELHHINKLIDRLASILIGDQQHIVQAALSVESKARGLRVSPFAEACQGLERTVRDLAKNVGKEVRLEISGEEVEIDRSVIERLKDPLLHLVRNSIDHGIEPPAERQASGKQAHGLISVSAKLRGDQIEIVVKDDGRGLNEELIRAQARKRGLSDFSSEAELREQIFMPGFSTSAIITEISGRGVGLDIVRDTITSLYGRIELLSELGEGTQFTMLVPLTLTTVRVLLLRVHGHTFALTSTNIDKALRVALEDFKSVEGQETIALADKMVPVVSLAQAIELPMTEIVSGRKIPAVLAVVGERRTLFLVDELIAEQEVVVKSLGSRIKRLRHFSGAAFLPSGEIALVLNPFDLINSAIRQRPGAILKRGEVTAVQASRKRLIVVEDSLTTRSLEKSILEAAGYEVATASNGAQAWQILQEKGADLIVSDVEMPIMDGFALAEAVRASTRFCNLPIVLVTACARDTDKARGIEAGASAYLVKSDFDQTNLLETIQQLL